MMGGGCAGGAFVEQYFYGSECKDCPLSEGYGECQVLTGQEPAAQCPALQEFIRYEGIKLYGVNREQGTATGRRQAARRR